MKTLMTFSAAVLATPALAHGGGHLHPHGAESWLALLPAVALIATALVIWARR
ncbi:hypothetical protein [Antarctobacter jejuensis]|uniref:hypothetical protein n=1 Tax=Antarctobacter jejuensis TaxID=1439938 RepID=UPI003FD45982